MFKDYHIVIFKDREGGVRNLRLRGWLGALLFLLVGGLAAGNYYLWDFYARSKQLEHELEVAQRTIRSHDNQVLSLTGRLRELEGDVQRVQKFDAQLRVLMNVDKDPADAHADGGQDLSEIAGGGADVLNSPMLLSRHRELYLRRLHSLVEELSANILLEEVEQQTLVGLLRANKDSLLSTPSVWPVKGYLTSGFGRRRAPLSGAARLHKGLDISNKVGTPVRAPARGAVTFSGWDGAYGICIMVDHGNGVVTRYAHMQKASVAVGDYVQRGDVIGALGNTGRSTGPHLHYEVLLNGTPVDPMRYILN